MRLTAPAPQTSTIAMVLIAAVLAIALMVVREQSIDGFRALGQVVGLAIVPLLLQRFVSERAGWLALILLGLAFIVGSQPL